MTDQATTGTVEVSDAAERSRFEISVDGRVAGFLEYSSRPGLIVFTHTEIGDGYQGRGLAGRLAAAALAAVRDRGLRVRPVCEYLADYVRRHPGYADLLEPRSRPVG